MTNRRNPQNRQNPHSFVELRRCLTWPGFEGYELSNIDGCSMIITWVASICASKLALGKGSQTNSFSEQENLVE
ncbi:hypothetical protein [Crocosphaera subtropica]|uniref:hypothetical protein n=1 Tax=Crocosphaera subtropica TaxID=2546360 RepID=UPI0012EBC656|nr:hypothetical protein [Crocosphaera subtropica]